MAFNRFGAGRKVYGQGSYAPTKGTLKPDGYIQREVQRRNQQAQPNQGVSQTGRDGQSDTRSGLAAQAMQRRDQPRPGSGVGRSPQAHAVGQKNNGTRAGQSATGSAPGFKPGPSGAAVSTAPATPSVNVSPTGQLELPYNSEFANMALDAQMQFDAENLALQQAQQEQDLEFQRNNRDLDQGYDTQKRTTLNGNAAAGTAFSSAYGVGVNEDTRNYTNMKNDLAADDALFDQGITGQRNLASSRMNQLIQRATQSYADSLAGEAGTLGFGTSSPDPVSAPKGGGNKNKNKGNKKDDKPRSGGGVGQGRPPRPGPNYVWRDGKWKKDK